MVFDWPESIYFYRVNNSVIPHASSVRVPVLSNTIIFTRPALFTADGAIQNMPTAFSLSIANRVPVTIAVGNVGGTSVVIRFKQLSTTSHGVQYFMNLGNTANHKIKEMKNMNIMK